MNSQVRKMVRELERRGWTHTITGGNHVKLVAPNGGIVICGGTPSDVRSYRNIEARIRAVETGRPSRLDVLLQNRVSR